MRSLVPAPRTLHTNAYSADGQHASAKYVLVLFIALYHLWLSALYYRYSLYLVFDNPPQESLHYRTPHFYI